MLSSQFDVVVVGAGAAGLAAAIGLARADFRVLVLEAAHFPGAENWSGCVYFAENLADPELLGVDGVEALAWERRLVERGFYATDGHGLLGVTYRDPAAFRHCYTVLRPIYDHHLAQVAQQLGVVILASTTAESLIRERGRVVGVCTNRGPVYADLVFLAEGDASHLVTREGYETFTDPHHQPKFLQGIKQVIDLPAGAIETLFKVGPEEGVAYEMLLRNGTLRGKPVHLNMGGFLYANRQSLSVGLVLPADNLHEHFGGDPNLLLEWFENLPALQPWFRDGKRGVFGAKIIRGGGARDIPRLVDDGLAIGGAASAVGVDFPYPNFTGPATAMGLLLARAARQIRSEGSDFNQDNLERHYLQPLRRSHYYQDVEFLRRWPDYVKKTTFFFDRHIDLALGTVNVWTRPEQPFWAKWSQWLALLQHLAPPGGLAELQREVDHLDHALRLQESLGEPSRVALFCQGINNALRDLFGTPRRGLPQAGAITLHYAVAGAPVAAPPRIIRRLLARYRPVLAAAAHLVYSNNDTPLHKKLPTVLRLLLRQVNLFDGLLAGGFAALAKLWQRFRPLPQPTLYEAYAVHATRTSDLTATLAAAAQNWERRLGSLGYDTVAASHIHLLWPQSLPERTKVSAAGLWHVCPAHVYEARTNANGQLQVVVNFENCIKCETCWRTSDLVDWGRDGKHRFVYPVTSPVVTRLLRAVAASGRCRPTAALTVEPWEIGIPATTPSANGVVEPHLTLSTLLDRLEGKLLEFETALGAEPRTVDLARHDALTALAWHARQLAALVHNTTPSQLAADLTVLAESRCLRVAQRRYSWAAADGRQMRMHHLVGLRTMLGIQPRSHSTPVATSTSSWRAELAELLGPTIWRELEQGQELSPQQSDKLLSLTTTVPRHELLAELGRRDPSLAYRVAHHLWAGDLAALVPELAGWDTGGGWNCVAAFDSSGEALLVPARHATRVLLWSGARLGVLTTAELGSALEPLETLGFRGAGPARIRLDARVTASCQSAVDAQLRTECWSIASSRDLIAIARGMADILCQRAVAHATSRVQFPGLFHDEQSRDPIGKFGAVKRMIAAMAAHHALLCVFDEQLRQSPTRALALACKAVAAEILAPAPGSITYNAGQVFGGTGFSEDDILSKYFRDANAWRVLGIPNAVIQRLQGEALLDHGVALCPDAALFAEIEQRAALHDELHAVQQMEHQLTALRTEQGRQGAERELLEALGRQDGLLLASKLFLLDTHRQSEAGNSAIPQALLRVWLSEAQFDLQQTSDRLQRQLRTPSLANNKCTNYADYLRSAQAYDSGDFLLQAFDAALPRLVPEMVASDPELARVDAEFRQALAYFGPRDGLIYERWIEAHHRPSDADLAYCRAQNFFRLPIPKELGGEHRRKLEYYLLVINTQRHVDVGISLLIQVNSSLGTTPILVARDKDLPKAAKELAPFVNDAGLHQEIEQGVAQLLALLARADAGAIKTSYQALHKRLGEAVLSRTTVRVLAQRFLTAWTQAGKAGLELDLGTMTTQLTLARAAWQEVCTGAAAYQQELKHRREACDLALRWIASGQISGFALTEPSAGSDTARIATRAKLCSVPVAIETDGVLRFVPQGGKEPRYLLDARKLLFQADGVFYRYADNVAPARVCFDDYDYETDDPRRMPYYQHGSRRIPFTDISQIRVRDGEPWYDYWEMTGSKMWITNGRMAGILCLYARTEEGVTAFIVDRHAEGLVVGKDEAKMGQRGSPTNELSLQAVRVPRENMLGLEGRGQVNALETLNVGRAGLAMSAMSQMSGIVATCEAVLATLPETDQPGAAWRVARMREEQFISEALAFDIIGKFEHPQTKSIRLESAIAKMFVSESLHRVIELAEEVLGLPGQTHDYLIEKRRRDARVLNIYEGTNEIQRFFILRDVVSEVIPRWVKTPATAGTSDLERLQQAVRQRVEQAWAFLGASIWQNPNLQANCFLLAEAVAWLKAAESTLGRIVWRQSNEEYNALTALGWQAWGRCCAEVERRVTQFDAELTTLKKGRYACHVRAAELLFTQAAQVQERVDWQSHIQRKLALLVVVEPVPGVAPQPHFHSGQLQESFWTLSRDNRSALELALRFREQAHAPVEITVAAVGSLAWMTALREVASLGIHDIHLVVTATPVPPDQAAAALVDCLKGRRYDLLLSSDSATYEEGVQARLVAAQLGLPHAGRAARLALQTSATESVLLLGAADGAARRQRLLPCAVGVEADAVLRDFTTTDFLQGLTQAVTIHEFQAAVDNTLSFHSGTLGTVSSDVAPRGLSVPEAADYLRTLMNLQTGVVAPSFTGKLTPVQLETVDTATFLAVLAAPGGQLGPAAEQLLRICPLNALVLVFVPNDESLQRQAAGKVLERFTGRICLVACGETFNGDLASRLLVDLLAPRKIAAPLIVGETWTEGAFAELSRQTLPGDRVVLRVQRVEALGAAWLLETRRLEGKIAVRQTLSLPVPGRCWLSLADKVTVTGLFPPQPLATGQVLRWTPKLRGFYERAEIRRLIDEVKAATGLVRLTDAEFILDVGFGVGNRDGYEAVIEPLESALRQAGVTQLVIGGSRKVTEELHLLPVDRQIGQSGVNVNPRVLLAVGISGAPQHLNYIGTDATILAFNHDPEAPLMTLNRRQPRPRVFPVLGDLFTTVPAFIEALREDAK